MTRGWKRYVVLAVLGCVYIIVDALLGGENIGTNLISTILLGLLGLIIQYYYKKDPNNKSLWGYIIYNIKDFFQESPIEKLVAMRVKATWIDQYMAAIKKDVKQFDVEFTYFRSKRRESKKQFHAKIDRQLKLQLGESENEHSTKINHDPDIEEHHSISEKKVDKYTRCLILGQAGGGKTVLMLHLVSRFLTKKLEDNDEDRIPIVLNLSTYKSTRSISPLVAEGEGYKNKKQQSQIELSKKFENWLYAQLKAKYGVQQSDATKFIGRDDFILFLDGIDDLVEENNGKKDDINEVIEALNAFVKERDNKKINKKNRLSYVITSRDSTWVKLQAKPIVEETIIVKPLSNETIKKVLDIQSEESMNPDHANYYSPVLLEYLKPTFETPDDKSSVIEKKYTPQQFALEKARRPYLLNVMRKTAKMRESRMEDIEEWFIDYDDDLKELFSEYISSKLNDNRFRKGNKYNNDDKALRWLQNVAKWSNGSEFLIEQLQPRQLLFDNGKPKPGVGYRLYLAMYAGAVTLYTILVIAVPVGLSLFYEWNFHEGDSCFGAISNLRWAEISERCQPGIQMGWFSFLWVSGMLTIVIPLTFTVGSMRIRDEEQISARGKSNIISETLSVAWKNRGIHFAICLGLALGLARYILIKHSYDDATGQVFDDKAAIANFVATFFACACLFIVLTGRKLLREGLYYIKPADDYEIDRRRAGYAILGGLVATLIFLIPVLLQILTNWSVENNDVIFGRAVGFGSMLIFTLPLLYSYRPVSDKRIKTQPNHGIKKHAKNAFFSFVILFLVGTVTLYFGYGAFVDPPSGTVNAICGINFSILALLYGLLSVFRHYSLRIVIAYFPRGESRFPFFIADFLNHMERIGIIRKVGGRYLFEHNLLRKYLEKL